MKVGFLVLLRGCIVHYKILQDPYFLKNESSKKSKIFVGCTFSSQNTTVVVFSPKKWVKLPYQQPTLAYVKLGPQKLNDSRIHMGREGWTYRKVITKMPKFSRFLSRRQTCSSCSLCMSASRQDTSYLERRHI